MIKYIEHIGLQTAELERALAFYCGVLGFERQERMVRDGHPGPQFVNLPNGQSIEFFEGEAKPADASPYRHLCLIIEDMQAVVDTLARHNVAIDRGPVEMGTRKMMWMSDPDGNTIEFKQL